MFTYNFRTMKSYKSFYCMHKYIKFKDIIVMHHAESHINDENITICSKSESTPNKAIKKKLSDYSPGVISSPGSGSG